VRCAGDAEQHLVADRELGVPAGVDDEFIPDHRVRRIAGSRFDGGVRRARPRRVDHAERDPAILVDAQGAQAAEHAVGGQPGDVGLHQVARGRECGPRQHGEVRRSGLAQQQVAHRGRPVRRTDHPQVQHSTLTTVAGRSS